MRGKRGRRGIRLLIILNLCMFTQSLPKNKHIFLLILFSSFLFIISRVYIRATEHYALMAWKVKQLKLIYTPLVIGTYCLSFSLLIWQRNFFSEDDCKYLSDELKLRKIFCVETNSSIDTHTQVAQQHNHQRFLLNFTAIQFPLIFTASFLTAG
jgi:phosphatidylglycerophosphate synthase